MLKLSRTMMTRNPKKLRLHKLRMMKAQPEQPIATQSKRKKPKMSQKLTKSRMRKISKYRSSRS
jgi:hypothetical protein